VLSEHHHGFLAKLFGGNVAAGVQREARLHRVLPERLRKRLPSVVCVPTGDLADATGARPP
jgi:hypothetical protein